MERCKPAGCRRVESGVSGKPGKTGKACFKMGIAFHQGAVIQASQAILQNVSTVFHIIMGMTGITVFRFGEHKLRAK